MVLSPAPIAEPTEDEPAARTLAYEQAISKPREKSAEAEPDASTEKADAADETAEVPPFETVTSAAEPETSDNATDLSAMPDLPPDESADAPNAGGDPSQDMAAVQGTDGAEQWGDERNPPWAADQPGDPYGPPGQGDPYAEADPYGPPGQGDPYAEADPYGAQGDPYGEADPYGPPPNAEEWVEVIISGAPMRATASDDAPMLFAFPYGRNLKVVSRYEGWVEVTDPKSAATGWMQAHALAPSRANSSPYGQNEAYYEDPRRRRGGNWFERNANEFSDMLNRAFGGGGY